VAFMDGTHCEISVPAKEEREHFSEYKGCHTQSYLIWVNAIGFVIKVCGPYKGSLSDRATYNTTEFATENNGMLSPGEKVIADGGLFGEGEFIVPARLPEINKSELNPVLRQSLIDFNEEVADNRALVEHAIHVVKSRAQTLTNRFGRNINKQSELFLAACKLSNRIRRLRLQPVVEKFNE